MAILRRKLDLWLSAAYKILRISVLSDFPHSIWAGCSTVAWLSKPNVQLKVGLITTNTTARSYCGQGNPDKVFNITMWTQQLSQFIWDPTPIDISWENTFGFLLIKSYHMQPVNMSKKEQEWKCSVLLEDWITFIPQTQENAWCWETVQCSFSVLLYLIYQHSKNSLEKLLLYHGFFWSQ